MASIVALKATKAMKTGSKVVKKVNKVGSSISEHQDIFKYGKKILNILGFGSDSKDDEILKKLEEIQSDVKLGFHETQTRLDELQLANSINEKLYYLDYHYRRIHEIIADNSDPDERDRQLTQLLLLGTGVNKEDQILSRIDSIKKILLGEIAWSPSQPHKSVGDIIHDVDKELAGNERYEYLNSAAEYYSYNLCYLYEGLFVLNFIISFFEQESASEDTIVEEVQTAMDLIEACEDGSPLWTYTDYFEMKICAARTPSTYDKENHNRWFLMTSGEYLIYNFYDQSIYEGPFRLGSTHPTYKPPIGFNNIPAAFYYPDAIYNQRTSGPDDYYFIFKGDQFIKYFWDKGTHDEDSSPIPTNLPCKDGVVAAMQNSFNGYTYLFNNVGNEVHSYQMLSPSWYDQDRPSYVTVKMDRTDMLVDGGGVSASLNAYMEVFTGQYHMKLQHSSNEWKVINQGLLTKLLPGLAGTWNIEELRA